MLGEPNKSTAMSLIVCRSISYRTVFRRAWTCALALAERFVAFGRRMAGVRRTLRIVPTFTEPT
jgi:hypothetical protein